MFEQGGIMKPTMGTFVSAVILICLTGTSFAQQAPATSAPAVRMVVTAEPHKGKEVATITQQDVAVHEGKDRDTVTGWVPAQGENAALELFILLDDSANMTLGSQLADIKNFVNQQPSTTKVGVAYMQNGMARIVENLTSDHQQAANAIRLPMGTRGANASPYFSVSDLIKRWPATNARREMLVASDGIDPYYPNADFQDPYLDTAISDAQRAGILISAIYTPGVGHFAHSYWMAYWGQLYLAEMADKTGGESYYIGFTGPPVAFAPFLEDMMDRLNRQYLLTFLPRPVKKAGLRPVRVTTELQNVDLVSAKQVYVTPAKE